VRLVAQRMPRGGSFQEHGHRRPQAEPSQRRCQMDGFLLVLELWRLMLMPRSARTRLSAHQPCGQAVCVVKTLSGQVRMEGSLAPGAVAMPAEKPLEKSSLSCFVTESFPDSSLEMKPRMHYSSQTREGVEIVVVDAAVVILAQRSVTPAFAEKKSLSIQVNFASS